MLVFLVEYEIPIYFKIRLRDTNLERLKLHKYWLPYLALLYSWWYFLRKFRRKSYLYLQFQKWQKRQVTSY